MVKAGEENCPYSRSICPVPRLNETPACDKSSQPQNFFLCQVVLHGCYPQVQTKNISNIVEPFLLDTFTLQPEFGHRETGSHQSLLRTTIPWILPVLKKILLVFKKSV